MGDVPGAPESVSTPPRPTPWRLWLGLFAAVALDAPVQLIWKALMIKYGDPARAPHQLFTHDLAGAWHQARWFLREVRTYVLFVLFGCQFLDWLYVLGNADLSFAQPFTALSYVAVSGCAVAYFHEHLTPLRVVGIALILAGVALVGSSESRAGAEA
jgi:multidrug transporter EmrE-like cation transporter